MTCPGTGGSVMIPTGGNFCIDRTEVTRGQYANWVATGPSTADQAAHCSWNKSFEPSPACMAETSVCTTGCDDHPQPCVDWCDAHAYCVAMGKRLCGAIGGGPVPADKHSDASVSQWHHACSSGGIHYYPYGDAYVAQHCNGKDQGVESSVVTGSMQDCEATGTGYGGIFDLSGNVWEWEDACGSEAGASDKCGIRGGSYRDAGPALQCAGGIDGARDLTMPNLGFRCCGP